MTDTNPASPATPATASNPHSPACQEGSGGVVRGSTFLSSLLAQSAARPAADSPATSPASEAKRARREEERVAATEAHARTPSAEMSRLCDVAAACAEPAAALQAAASRGREVPSTAAVAVASDGDASDGAWSHGSREEDCDSRGSGEGEGREAEEAELWTQGGSGSALRSPSLALKLGLAQLLLRVQARKLPLSPSHSIQV